MHTCGYKFYLRLTGHRFERKQIKFVSTSGHAIFWLYYIKNGPQFSLVKRQKLEYHIYQPELKLSLLSSEFADSSAKIYYIELWVSLESYMYVNTVLSLSTDGQWKVLAQKSATFSSKLKILLNPMLISRLLYSNQPPTSNFIETPAIKSKWCLDVEFIVDPTKHFGMPFNFPLQS